MILNIDYTIPLNSIISGVLASLVFSIMVYLIQRVRYWVLLRRRFHNADFISYHKSFSTTPIQNIKLKVRGNIINYTGVHVKDDDKHEGQLIMNPINLKVGKGFYFHNQSDGFGFPTVIIKDTNTILLEAPYTAVRLNEKTNKVDRWTEPQAFIWRRKSTIKESSNTNKQLDEVLCSPTGAALNQFPDYNSLK